MKKKFVCVMTAVLMLSGCASDSIEYVNDGTAESSEKRVEETADKQSVSNDEKTTEASTGETEFSDISWIEDFSVCDGKGVAHVSLNPKEKIKDEEYKIITAKEITDFSNEDKEKFMRNLFSDSEIYIYDEDHLPKYFLEEMMKNYEKNAKESDNDDAAQVWWNAVDEIKAIIDTCPDDFVPADSFEGDTYLAFYDNIPYNISFCINQKTGWDMGGVVMPGIDRYINIYCREDLMRPEDKAQIVYNNELKRDEIKEIADRVVEKLDFDDIKYYQTSVQSQGGLDDWLVEYYQGVKVFDGNNGPLRIDAEGNEYATGEKRGINVSVSGGILDKLEIYFPIEIMDVEEVGQLADFDTIKEVITDELINNNDGLFWNRSDANGNIRYMITDMELGYMYIPEKDNTVKLIPCWRFGGEGNGMVYPIVVNAVDGKEIKNCWWDDNKFYYQVLYEK